MTFLYVILIVLCLLAALTLVLFEEDPARVAFRQDQYPFVVSSVEQTQVGPSRTRGLRSRKFG